MKSASGRVSLTEAELHADLSMRAAALQGKFVDLLSHVGELTQAEVQAIRDGILVDIHGLTVALESATDEIKHTVIETIVTIREALNIPRLVRRDPWPSLLLSLVFGTLVGSLVGKTSSSETPPDTRSSSPSGMVGMALGAVSKSLGSALAREILHRGMTSFSQRY